MFRSSYSARAVRRFGQSFALVVAAFALTACGSSNRSATTDTPPLPVPDIEAVHIASNTNGDAIAVWQQTDGTVINVYARRYLAAGGWQAAVLLESEDGDATRPRVVMNAAGTAFAVWQQSDGVRTNIRANRFDAHSGAWQGATEIETEAGDATRPEAAIDPQGNAFVVWEQSDGARINALVNRYVNGLGWQTPALLETSNAGDAARPRVAMNANGFAFAVWQQSDGTRSNIWANRFNAAVSPKVWQGADLLETDDSGDAQNPDVALDNAGNAFAVWQHHDGAVSNIVANRYINGLGWQTPVLLEANDAGDAVHPRIAMNADGFAFAVWQQSDGVRVNIWANRFDYGATPKAWQGALAVEFSPGDAARPDVAVNAAGDAVAVWQQSDGVRINIYKNRHAAGAGWGLPGLVETDDAGDAKNARIALDGAGNAFAAWLQSDGAQVSGRSTRFTP